CSTSSWRANSAAVASGSASATPRSGSRSGAAASGDDVDGDGEVAVDPRRNGARLGGCALMASEPSHGPCPVSAGPRYGATRANVPLRLDQALGGAAGRSARAVSGLRNGPLGRLVGSIGRRTRPAVRPVAPNRRMALGPPRRHTARDPRDVGEAAGAEDRRGDAG